LRRPRVGEMWLQTMLSYRTKVERRTVPFTESVS
jgi:hypothetical protein